MNDKEKNICQQTIDAYKKFTKKEPVLALR